MREVENVLLLDSVDKNILQEMSKGVSSYDEMAQKLNINRSTVYRRIRALERSNLIKFQTRASVNFAKLDLIAVLVGMNISNLNAERVVNFLSVYPCVKMIWQSFGSYNLFAILFCDKGEEGSKILEIRKMIEEFEVASFDIAVGFKWEKMDLTPFDNKITVSKQFQVENPQTIDRLT
jgi:DNA-binding Lrp family transcriptional regulator